MWRKRSNPNLNRIAKNGSRKDSLLKLIKIRRKRFIRMCMLTGRTAPACTRLRRRCFRLTCRYARGGLRFSIPNRGFANKSTCRIFDRAIKFFDLSKSEPNAERVFGLGFFWFPTGIQRQQHQSTVQGHKNRLSVMTFAKGIVLVKKRDLPFICTLPQIITRL